MKILAVVILTMAVTAVLILAALFILQAADRAAADKEWRRGLEDDYYD